MLNPLLPRNVAEITFCLFMIGNLLCFTQLNVMVEKVQVVWSKKHPLLLSIPLINKVLLLWIKCLLLLCCLLDDITPLKCLVLCQPHLDYQEKISKKYLPVQSHRSPMEQVEFGFQYLQKMQKVQNCQTCLDCLFLLFLSLLR